LCTVYVDVSATFSGGAMDSISVQGFHSGVGCHNTADCSTKLPKGHTFEVTFGAENRNFEYTCPGESPTMAHALSRGPPDTEYVGIWPEAQPTPVLSEDYVVTGHFVDS